MTSPSLPREPSFLLTIPVTHTWGYQATKVGLDRYESYLYETILFEDRALLSAAERARRRGVEDSSVGPNAKAAGLINYVFSYLGVHDPYYSRGAQPAFGVFIRPDREQPAPEQCHASRRDLDSPEAAEGGAAHELNHLLPEHGRQLAHLECHFDERHNRDEWKYWSASEFFIPDGWEWKIEMRFLERVPVEGFIALLWPVSAKALTLQGGRSFDTKLSVGADRFQADHPGCVVVKYKVSAREGGPMSLVRASTGAARSFVTTGEFPRLIEADGSVLQ